MIKIVFTTMILAFILVSGCTSQQEYHMVNFHFTDQNNIPIVHALISTTDQAQGNIQNYTDENGNVSFELNGLVEYSIMVSNLKDGQQRIVIITPNETENNVSIIAVPSTQIPTLKPTQKLYTPQDLANDTNYWTNIFRSTVTKYI